MFSSFNPQFLTFECLVCHCLIENFALLSLVCYVCNIHNVYVNIWSRFLLFSFNVTNWSIFLIINFFFSPLEHQLGNHCLGSSEVKQDIWTSQSKHKAKGYNLYDLPSFSSFSIIVLLYARSGWHCLSSCSSSVSSLFNCSFWLGFEPSHHKSGLYPTALD